MSATAIKDSDLTAFAERVYIEQKDQFVHDFADYIKSRIEAGEAQFENGQYMSLEDSKNRLYTEIFNQKPE